MGLGRGLSEDLSVNSKSSYKWTQQGVSEASVLEDR